MQTSVTRPPHRSPHRSPAKAKASGRASRDEALAHLVRSQALNARRNAAELKPFRDDEFGEGPGSPSAAHIGATNALIGALQTRLLGRVKSLDAQAKRAPKTPTPGELAALLAQKERAERGTKDVERIWAYYFTLFNQRQTRFGPLLLAVDRIALDCYRVVYTGLGEARPVPSPPPFSFMETGRTPSTFRRGVKLSKLGWRANPFPIVQLPQHRLVNPWTLGAVHHEVSHNLQSDLGLWGEVPRRLGETLTKAGLPPDVSGVWRRWHKEI